MNPLRWAGPNPRRMDWMYPTSLDAFEACPKRLGFQRDEEFSHWSRGSTRAGIGKVAHRLTELVHSGQAPLDGRRAWLEQQWALLIAEEHALLKDEWDPGDVPMPADWRGVTATRVRLLRALQDVEVDSAPHSTSVRSEVVSSMPTKGFKSSDGGPMPWVERALFDSTTHVAGRPDRVEERRGALRVVDLKSGVNQREILPTQRRQLMIYAHLVRAVRGILPQEVVVADPRGRESCVEVETSEVDMHVRSATDALAQFNSLADGSSLPASAAADTCRWCSFRVVCSAYWFARDDTWDGFDVRGVVDGVESDSLVVRDAVDQHRRTRVIGSQRLAVSVGDEIVALDLERAGPGAGRLRWWSRFRSPASDGKPSCRPDQSRTGI